MNRTILIGGGFGVAVFIGVLGLAILAHGHAIQQCTDACGYARVLTVTESVCMCQPPMADPPPFVPGPSVTADVVIACKATCAPRGVSWVHHNECWCDREPDCHCAINGSAVPCDSERWARNILNHEDGGHPFVLFTAQEADPTTVAP